MDALEHDIIVARAQLEVAMEQLAYWRERCQTFEQRIQALGDVAVKRDPYRGAGRHQRPPDPNS